MTIEQIEIEGIDDGDYTCKKCEIIVNDIKDNNVCHTCDEDTYFDKETVKL